MALTEAWQQKVQHVVAGHIAREPRYKTLVFQSASLFVLDGVLQAVRTLANATSLPLHTADAGAFLDGVGAMSYSHAIDLIDELAANQLLAIAGPLQFIDYWSSQGRSAFWRYLATANRGLGIIVTDVPRDVDSESVFRLVMRVGGTDLHCLKSRLATGEDETT